MVAGLNVLVSGCSIAGPAAAWWLARSGQNVTIIERSTELRAAGQNIDVRGSGREVLRRMNLEASVLARNTGELGTRVIDDRGHVLLELPAGRAESDGATAEAEILRGELSKLLVDHLPDTVVLRFGQQIHAVTQHDEDEAVQVTYQDGATEDFDLVVVAEGTRSRTRELVFGEVPTRAVGLYTAFGTIPRGDNDNRYWNWYNAPGGRSVSVRPDNKSTTRVALSFLSPAMGYEDLPVDEQRRILRRKYAGAGWDVPRILDGVDRTDELYVDYLTQVRATNYACGRVVLLGDAAWCSTPLSGLGTSLALTGAYVLAGELAWNASVSAALRRYQEQMEPFVRPAQKLPPRGPRLVHPKSSVELGIMRAALRVVGSRPIRGLAGRVPAARRSHGRDLPTYPELRS